MDRSLLTEIPHYTMTNTHRETQLMQLLRWVSRVRFDGTWDTLAKAFCCTKTWLPRQLVLRKLTRLRLYLVAYRLIHWFRVEPDSVDMLVEKLSDLQDSAWKPIETAAAWRSVAEDLAGVYLSVVPEAEDAVSEEEVNVDV